MEQHRAFDETITEIVGSLGDPTRRSIYLAIRGSDHPQSVAAIGERFGLHPNVARYHLDYLVQAGYLRVTTAPAGPGAGRPAYLYEAADREIHVDLPRTRFDLLAQLLIRALDHIPDVDASQMAHDVGFTYGAEVAPEADVSEHPDMVETVQKAAQAMRGLGFDISPPPSECEYQTVHCPFGEMALENPGVVCELDRGLVGGLMQSLNWPADVTVLPHTTLDTPCVTRIKPSDGRP